VPWAYDTVITGGARGVDSVAHEAAKGLKLKTRVFMAEWDKYGKKAGYIRNERMARSGDFLLAIWDGRSPGTRNMIAIMRSLGKEYERFGVRCVTHGNAKTTELAHILNNSAYGISLMFADEMAKLCREYGVDYYEAVMKYTETHNRGFRELDHPRLVRSILTP